MKKALFVFLLFFTFFLAPTSAFAQQNNLSDPECLSALDEVRSSVEGMDDAYAFGDTFEFSVQTDIFSRMSANCGPTGTNVDFQVQLYRQSLSGELEPSNSSRILRSSSDNVAFLELSALEDPEPVYYRMDVYVNVCRNNDCDQVDFMSHSFCFSETGNSCDPNELPEEPTQSRSTHICNQVPSADKDVCCSCVTGNPGCLNNSNSQFEVKAIWTAIGCVSTNPTEMISSVMRVGLSIAGGVTVLVLLAAGFLFSTSQGDPKRTSDAKDMMTSAVVGLLFIIFSVTILQFIGVDVLQIPGFGGA